ncbi:nickel/cobalt transporter [Marinomonas balearica]|uniref:Nickel/cobalt efflux system n=1 Tax=Marinomonas balearica TaxID=491947 RepID=A0A4R6M7X5_9GAMM|nr:nickel transporter [Marinomonas balearica]TDO97266.1 ABC-type nickel/cobalt efflux system permease component RcnA [Marinomonas balearica]
MTTWKWLVGMGLALASGSVWAFDLSGYQDFTQWIMTYQREFHRSLVGAVRGLSKGENMALLWSLVSVSFGYGVFHAAGPGHGKAVIASYMLASKAPLRKGVSIAFLSAMAQGLMAITVVLIMAQLFSVAGKAVQISRFFELVSFAAVGFIGVWMLSRLIRGKSSCGHDHSHDHLHHHEHSHDGHICSHDHSSSHTCSHHEHEQSLESQSETKTAQRSLWAMVAAIGIRPCSGAVLVLLFSLSANILQWGILSTLAMSLGTAITVSILAITSVMIRGAGTHWSHGIWRQRLQKGFGYFASCALIVISASMIWSDLTTSRALF